MKSDRLLAALMLLQGSGRLSTRELAERLEISQRTAHRDMESLCAAGVPLIAHRGAQGGWELEKGWRTQVPALDHAELEGLLMAQTGTLGTTKLRAAAQRAFDKLMAALPASSRSQAESMRQRLHFDPSGWWMRGEDLSMLPIVQDALSRDRKLTFLYTRGDGEMSTRTADPLGIVCKQSIWYLVAQTPKGMRTFRVSRIRGAVVLTQPVERPAGFDLAAHWKASTASMQDRAQPLTVTLALSPKGVSVMRGWRPIEPVTDLSAEYAIERDWQVFSVEFESHPHARFGILGLGAHAVVLAPQDLRNEIQQEATQIIERHKASFAQSDSETPTPT